MYMRSSALGLHWTENLADRRGLALVHNIKEDIGEIKLNIVNDHFGSPVLSVEDGRMVLGIGAEGVK